MPGLLRGVARTAVVAGTATAVSNRISRPHMQSKLAQLKELGELKTQGVLTDAESEAQKSKILGS